MAYICNEILDSLSEENRLILHLISRLEDATEAIAKYESQAHRDTAFVSIRFLTRCIVRLLDLELDSTSAAQVAKEIEGV